MTDRELLQDARDLWGMYNKLATAHAEMSYAIDMHLRGGECWGHLLEWAMHLDEGMEDLMDAVKR